MEYYCADCCATLYIYVFLCFRKVDNVLEDMKRLVDNFSICNIHTLLIESLKLYCKYFIIYYINIIYFIIYYINIVKYVN